VVLMMRLVVLDPPDAAGHRYRFVPSSFQSHFDSETTITKWCRDSFGEPDIPNYYSRWTQIGRSFWFRDDADAFAFRMRWC
jgi:hypothetical protein